MLVVLYVVRMLVVIFLKLTWDAHVVQYQRPLLGYLCPSSKMYEILQIKLSTF